MMMGPAKKRVIVTGIVAFIIPVIIATVLFIGYSNAKNKEINKLQEQGKVISAYIFSKNMLAGDIITSGDVKVVNVKAESAPIDSFSWENNEEDESARIAKEKREANKRLSEIVGKKMRINAEEKTIITKSMFVPEEEKLAKDERLQEFNMISLPSNLQVGDFVDIRMTMPEGEDYLVISGKEVKQIGSGTESNAIFLQIDEEEILRTTAAILESYLDDGFKLYANKYVNPSEQLYEYKRVNYVERFEKTLEELVKARQKLADENLEEYLKKYEPEVYEEHSGEINIEITQTPVISGDTTSGETTTKKIEKFTWTVDEEDIKTSEIAAKIGLSESQTEDIRKAVKENNQTVIALYNDKLVTTRKDMINTYPVKANIANLIKKNPNILDTIKAKYNVDKLVEERANLLEFPLYDYNEYGEYGETEAYQKLRENINKEIETRKNERKEYLQALILKESSSK